MADEQDKWLDRETAEFLLRGEPLEGADPAVRDRAERLVAALGALAPPVPAGEELPGEAAALAAFRKVRAEQADASAGVSAAVGHGAADRLSGAGPVRVGSRGEGARRPRRGRPLRLGLAAALTVGMIGGVAAAAGTGVLPTPFDRTEPEPAATVSAAASPGRPLAPPSPLDGVQGGSVPGATPGAPEGGTARDGGEAQDRGADDRNPGGSDGRRSSLAASCRKVRAGKELDTAHRHALKEAAGGASRVGKYCGALLAGTGTGGRDDTGRATPGGPVREGELRGDTGDGDGQGEKSDAGGKGGKDGKDGKSDEGEGKGNGKGNGQGKDKGKGQGKGDDDGNGGDEDDADIAPPRRGPHHPARPHHPDRAHGPHTSPAHRPQPQHTGAPHAA
ncbi:MULTISPECIES: hypothetical protein [unclassified Streptomyces]|uniref:hypothetical protein n=1 Tax=unclassified Streptomyces TaxID=2593676 RepID=UPI00087B4325|nr:MULTISPECIES: hypothetical protein [unclassified Streptomyces]REH23106.1 hypothetical protein BX268_4989 [Streptomyces sp. 2221.1]SDT72740.1 hypothetical protein SAMN05428941_4985 [Streptomyces sp. 2114.2]